MIVCLGGIALLVLYIYKKYVPPMEPKAPGAFSEEMPQELTNYEKFQLWRENIPSSYTFLLITFGSLLLLVYYGLEVTYFQFMAQFITATPLPIQGQSLNQSNYKINKYIYQILYNRYAVSSG